MTHSEFSHSEFQRHQTERDIPKKLNFLSSHLKGLKLIKITNKKINLEILFSKRNLFG